MSNEQLSAIRDFIYFVVEAGQLSGEDSDFIKASYYDFRLEQKEIKE